MTRRGSPPLISPDQSLASVFGLENAGHEAHQALKDSDYLKDHEGDKPLVQEIKGYLDSRGEMHSSHNEAMLHSLLYGLEDDPLSLSFLAPIRIKYRKPMLRLLMFLEQNGMLNDNILHEKKIEGESDDGK